MFNIFNQKIFRLRNVVDGAPRGFTKGHGNSWSTQSVLHDPYYIPLETHTPILCVYSAISSTNRIFAGRFVARSRVC